MRVLTKLTYFLISAATCFYAPSPLNRFRSGIFFVNLSLLVDLAPSHLSS